MTKSRTLYHGYLVLLSTFLLNFVAVGVFNSAGLYLGPLAATFPASGTSKLALYCTFQVVAGLASSFAGGIAQDALEKRGIGLQWLFFGGGVFMALGFYYSSIASALVGVLIGSLLMGIGIGFGGFMAGGVCVLWFEAARGMMLLLAMSGQGMGNVFFAWATARLLERYDHFDDPWRPTMRFMGILSLFLCGLASISMRLPLPGEVEGHEKKEGLEVKTLINYGATESSEEPTSNTQPGGRQSLRYRRQSMALNQMCVDTGHSRRSILRKERKRTSTMLGAFQAVGSSRMLHFSDLHMDEKNDDPSLLHDSDMPNADPNSLVSLLGDITERSYTLKELTFSSTNIWLNVFSLIACFPFLNMQVLLPSYITALGMPPAMGGHALAVFGIGDFLSNLTLGAVADIVGARRLFTLAFFNLSILFFIWPHCTTSAALSTVAFFYGYFCCTISSMPIIILADAYGESSSEHILALNGITNMVKFPGYLLGPSIAGLLVEISSGDYNLAANFSGFVTLIGTLALLMIPSPEKQIKQLSEKYSN